MTLLDVIKLSPQVYLYTGLVCPVEVPTEALTLRNVPDDIFGDGSHPTTRLCAGAVDLLYRLKKPNCFLDVGTGTGVLARIARARGAKVVMATDIDPLALASARAHVSMDNNQGDIQISSDDPDHWGAHFDLIVANILEEPLKVLAQKLSNALAPGGTLLISGFTSLQIPALKIAFGEVGLKYISSSHLEEWALLKFSRPL